MLFNQTFGFPDLAVVGLLVVLEGVLSIDNALVLGLLAGKLPKPLQKKALTYGLVGAVAFRIIAIGTASVLLKWTWVKLLGGGYLAYVAMKHFWEARKAKAAELAAPGAASKLAGVGFWSTVVVIELTDIAFAVDSILAAIALVGPAPAGTPEHAWHPKLWVVVVGGILGVILMRFAAVLFIKLLERFPRFETAAYLLVLVIGIKLLADWIGNDVLAAEGQHPVDFHSYHNPWFWGFWISMAVCFAVGFVNKGAKPKVLTPPAEQTV